MGCDSARTRVKVFGWIDLILTIVMFFLVGLLIYYMLTEETDWSTSKDSYGNNERLAVVWTKIGFVIVDQLLRFCTAIALIKAASIDTHPGNSFSTLKIWGWVTAVLIVLNLIFCLKFGLPYYFMAMYLPFKIIFFLVTYKFYNELKQHLVSMTSKIYT